ncbi:hypothetical protein ABMA58_06230, partial [Oceanospirillum sp. HFRX-1_2]
MAMYDIPNLLMKHRRCVEDIAGHFKSFFDDIDYTGKLPRQIKKIQIDSLNDLSNVLKGPGFYIIATDMPIENNPCKLNLGDQLKAVYRGHSYHVGERLESHL